VLYRDENTGGFDLEIDPSNPDIIYATMWEARQGPWENGAWSGAGGIFKSTDGGTTWKPLTRGFGAEGVTQADLAIAPSQPNRLIGMVASGRGVGVYRSDDAGESWTRITTDSRPAGRIGGGDLPVPAIHPTNPDIVFSASVVAWKSTDGGKTWTGFRGAPGGDDYQGVWINPEHRQRRCVVEFLVQPADRAALPRGRRQRVAVPRVQRPAGERVGLRGDTRHHRTDHRARMDDRWRRRIRLRGA
jgi:hypothetical protein